MPIIILVASYLCFFSINSAFLFLLFFDSQNSIDSDFNLCKTCSLLNTLSPLGSSMIDLIYIPFVVIIAGYMYIFICGRYNFKSSTAPLQSSLSILALQAFIHQSDVQRNPRPCDTATLAKGQTGWLTEPSAVQEPIVLCMIQGSSSGFDSVPSFGNQGRNTDRSILGRTVRDHHGPGSDQTLNNFIDEIRKCSEHNIYVSWSP